MDTNVCVFVESNHRFVSCKAFTTTAAFQASTVTSEYTVDYSFATYVKVDASFFCFNSFLRMFESCILVQVRRACVYAEPFVQQCSAVNVKLKERLTLQETDSDLSCILYSP